MLLVGGTDDDGEVEFELGRNEGKVARIDGAVFGCEENTELIRSGFRADMHDLVACGAEGEHEVAGARDRGEDMLWLADEREELFVFQDVLSREAGFLADLFQEKGEGERRGHRIAARIGGEDDERSGSFFQEFFECSGGGEGHTRNGKKSKVRKVKVKTTRTTLRRKDR